MIAVSAPTNGTCNDIKLYVDGNLITTNITRVGGTTAINTAGGSYAQGNLLRIGGLNSPPTINPDVLNGYTSAFMVYNTELSNLQIREIYRTIRNRF
jgi:hypothetical protein